MIATIGLQAQTPVLDKEPFDYETVEGPGADFFAFSYLRYGLPFGVDHPADLRIGRSFVLSSGARFQAKIAGPVRLNFGYGFTLNEFVSADAFRGYEGKLNDWKRTEKYKMNTVDLDGDLALRFVLNKPGNSFGLYLDLGATGFYRISGKDKLYYTDISDNENKVVQGKLSGIERWGYGYVARIGYQNLALTARYRQSTLLNPENFYYEAPEWSISLELYMGN